MPELNSAGPSIKREELEMPAQRQRSWLTDAEVIVQQEEDMETPPAVRQWLQQQRRSGAAAATADDPDLVLQHSLPQDDPQQRAEIAPLAANDGAGGTLTAAGADTAAERARVERDVAEADELLRQWEVSPRDQAPFDLTVQPAIGGEKAAVTLKGVTSSMKVGQLHWRIQQEMESKPHPDQQLLFILGGDKGALEDGELPIGAYGVLSGVKLHLAIRDEGEAAARRLARGQLRDDQRVAREARDAAQARRKRVVKRAAKVMCFVATTTLLVLLSAYFNGGCAACENGAACEGLFGACACAGNHLGEYCEHSCGEYGQVNGSACVCSGNHTGTFCEVTDMIMRSEYNNATVQAVTYTGEPTDLSFALQHELCAAAGRATPGSDLTGRALVGRGSSTCYSRSNNYVVTDDCFWEHQRFTHVSGSVGSGVSYMCAGSYEGTDCDSQVRVLMGATAAGSSGVKTLLGKPGRRGRGRGRPVCLV